MINTPGINSYFKQYQTGVQPQNKSMPVNQSQTSAKTPAHTQTLTTPPEYSKPDSTIHTSWLYVNDIHGKMTNMERIHNIAQEFDRIPAEVYSANFFTQKNNTSPVHKFKVASGDIILGANYLHNKVASKFMDWTGFIAATIGNHELDVAKPDDLAKLIDDANCNMLSINLEVDKNSPMYSRIKKSMIVNCGNQKVGLIGISPSDMLERGKMNATLKEFSIKDLDTTVQLLKDEVKNLQSQGVNIIALLSHSGNKNDKRIAKEVQGVDLIFGAHTHELITGIKEGENLFYSKTGEPVIITQAGQDGEAMGILNVDFDQNGVIKKAQNNIIKTRTFNRPLYIKDTVESILGKPETIGKVKSAPHPPEDRLVESNPHAYIIADAMRSELGTDISILNSGNIRGSFSEGPIDTRLISDITPFEDKMWVLSLTEKQIVDSVKVGLKSLTTPTHKPGILYVSGLKYKANKQGELLEMEFIDKNNQTHKIDINNPDNNKKYTVACDDFYATGGNGYLKADNLDEIVLKKYPIDKDKLACEHIKKLQQPIEIKEDNRIIITD